MIGIDISDRSIKVAELSNEIRPKLVSACWSPVAPDVIRRGVIYDIEAAVSTLEQSLQNCSPVPITGRTAVVSIPETQSFLRVIDMPQVPEVELREAVQWAVQAHIPFDLDRVYLDWQIVTSTVLDNNRQQVLVGAARRDVVDPLLAVLDGANISVVALELEAQAIVRCLLPRQSQEIEGALVVDLGATATNVIFFDRGAMRFTAEVETGGDNLTQQLAQSLHLRPSIAAEKKALVGVADVGVADVGVAGLEPGEQVGGILRQSTLDLIHQIERVVREMTTQSDLTKDIRLILLSGGSANLPGLTTIFGEVFTGVPVSLGNPWTNFTVDERFGGTMLSPADALHFTTAFGLALRRSD